MLVFGREKLVFLALPKTGTTALEDALTPKASVVFRNQPNLKHVPAYRYHRYMKPFLHKTGLKDLETVAVIRHPIDWLGSWYRYRARPTKLGAENYTGDITFADFVSAYCDDEHQPLLRIGNPARFLGDGDGGFGVDHLYRYEQMDQLVVFLENRLSTDIKLASRNVSRKMTLNLPDSLRARLEQTHPDMFEIWENAVR